MAANVELRCNKCDKIGGILICNDCKESFCLKHVNEHKNELEKQLDHLINQENQFRTNLKEKQCSNDLFNQIDLWRKENIEQIKQIAKQAKQDLQNLIEKSNEEFIQKSSLIKENLFQLKDSESFSEIRFNQLLNQFEQFKKEIDSFQLIKSTNSSFLKIQKEEPNKPTDTNSKNSTKISEKNEKCEGSILIREIDPYGYFIRIEHNGLTTTKGQDMIGWTLKRSIDSYQEIFYKFPNDFILQPKSSIKILSKQASQTLYSYEKDNILIAHSIQSWGIGTNKIINSLFDANGDEKHILIQTY